MAHVERGHGDEPRHEGAVLDGVPGPESAPTQLRVRPVGTGEQAEAAHHDRGAPEAPQHRIGGRAAAAPHRRRRHGGRREQQRQPEVEQGRVVQHRRMLEQRVEAMTVDRR